MSRPAKLQINQRGAWRDVMTVDLDQAKDVDMFVEMAAEMVWYSGQVATTTMRLMTVANPPVRLMSWQAAGGWKTEGNKPLQAQPEA